MTTGYFQEKHSATRTLESPSTPLSPGPPGSRTSALSNKVSSVLSSSYADLDIREALGILDERGVTNTPETRRHLRLDAQREVVDCNAEIIEDFGKVAEQLKRIGEAIKSINACCTDMRQQISTAAAATTPLVEEMSVLSAKKDEVELQQSLLDAFRDHFVMSTEELTTLTSLAEPVNDQFFVTLSRVKRIHEDCQVLLGTENQTLGLEIMEQSSRNINGAFQKLYRWVQQEFKTLNLENPQINSSIRRALRVLAERPALFQSCLDFFADAREIILSDAFHTALTGDTSDPNDQASTKPIELFAHDPLRYIGDMLAWTHSATVSEREALESLFISDGDEIVKSIRAGLESEPWSRAEDDKPIVFDGMKALNELVNRDVNGVGRSLRQRIEQVIQSHEDSTLVYRIANLINFYRTTFQKLLGPDSALLDMLRNLEESALRQFRATIRDRITVIQAELPQAPSDLSIPNFLSEALDQLKTLMKSFDTSLIPISSREADFRPVLVEALDPFLAGCDSLAKALEAPANAVFLVNCYLAARNTLTPFAFTESRQTQIDSTIEEHMSTLVDFQHAFFLHTSGLHPLIGELAPLTESDADLKKIHSLASFSPQALADTSSTLDDFLPSALMDAAENLKRLQSSKMIEEITEEAAARFCEDFDFIEGRIIAVDALLEQEHLDKDEVHEGLRGVFPRTAGEIRVLLS
ncbi:MAG: hypothetical protein M1825_004994 [Sarcosagium campestre]|nr:MAG: hypothetical protein M1825_004994 [Sarcosagium campestre]